MDFDIIKDIFERLTGINKIKAKSAAEAAESIRIAREAEAAASEAEQHALEAEKAKLKAEEEERLAKLTPKERATEKKEPWVTVLSTHVNKDNIRNGFFELDWNEYFVLELKNAGYVGQTEEEIVDQWFTELCRNVGKESDIDMNQRGTGYVKRALLENGMTEIG